MGLDWFKLPAMNYSWMRPIKVFAFFKNKIDKTQEVIMFSWHTMIWPAKILELIHDTNPIRAHLETQIYLLIHMYIVHRIKSNQQEPRTRHSYHNHFLTLKLFNTVANPELLANISVWSETAA